LEPINVRKALQQAWGCFELLETEVTVDSVASFLGFAPDGESYKIVVANDYLIYFTLVLHFELQVKRTWLVKRTPFQTRLLDDKTCKLNKH
jgi:hypothetical protein